MAITGLAVPFLSKYSNNNGTISYSEGRACGSAVEYSIDIDSSDDTPLYSDNCIIEHEAGHFMSAILKLSTTGITEDLAAWLLGLRSNSVTIWSGTELEETVTEWVYDDEMSLDAIGFGIVESHQINNVTKYKSLILPKCIPHIPQDAATTRGDKIDWQVPELEFLVERSDEDKHPWKREAWHDSEEDAAYYIKWLLGYEGIDNRVGYGHVGFLIVS